MSAVNDEPALDRQTTQLSARLVETCREIHMSVAWWPVKLSGAHVDTRVRHVPQIERQATMQQTWELFDTIKSSRARAVSLRSWLPRG